MSKISEDSILQAMLEHGDIDTEQAQVIISEAKRFDEMNKPEKAEKAPDQPYAIMVVDPDGIVPQGLTGFVIKMLPTYVNSSGEFDVSASASMWSEFEIPAHLRFAYEKFRNTKKGEKCNVHCVGDFLYDCPAATMKEAGIRVVTKEPAPIVPISPADVHLGLALQSIRISSEKSTKK